MQISTLDPTQRRALPKAFTLPPYGGLMNSQRWGSACIQSYPHPLEAQRHIAATMADAALLAQGIDLAPAAGVLARPNQDVPDTDTQWFNREVVRMFGRSIIPISALNDRYLLAYMERMKRGSMGTAESTSTQELISPHVVPYMLGGITDTAVQELIQRALGVYNIYYDTSGRTYHDATLLCNTGPGSYAHFDPNPMHWVNRELSEELQPYRNRVKGRLSREKIAYRTPAQRSLSIKQDELVNNTAPAVSFADSLLNGHNLWVPTMYNRLSRIKLQTCAEVANQFQEGNPHYSNLARHKIINGDAYGYAQKIKITETTFSRAVNRVFAGNWVDLDLYADADHIAHDVEVVLARNIIRKLAPSGADTPVIGPETLLGMSLLTGVPLAKWVEFATYDLQRRGETFLTSETVVQAVELIDSSELSASFSEQARDELRILRRDLDTIGQEQTIVRRMARKMRSGTQLLWTAHTKHPENSYHLVGFREVQMPGGLDSSIIASYRPRIDRVFTGEKA